MTAEQCETALCAGEALGVAVAADTAAYGEMGIGNTSSATLVAHKLTGTALDSLVGRGAGLDDAGLSRKQGILEQAARRTAVPLDARDALREYGGFEIVMMAGAMRVLPGPGRWCWWTGSSPAWPRWPRRRWLRRCGITSSSVTGPPSTATAWCWRPLTPVRCWSSTCASVKAPARCWRGLCSSARRPCCRRWRVARAPA